MDDEDEGGEGRQIEGLKEQQPPPGPPHSWNELFDSNCSSWRVGYPLLPAEEEAATPGGTGEGMPFGLFWRR